MQVRGTWCPPYKLTANRRHHFSHHRPSLYSVHVGILPYKLLTDGFISRLIGCKCQRWVGNKGCQAGAWFGFLVGETSRRCCGPQKHLKRWVWWGKPMKWTPRTAEKGQAGHLQPIPMERAPAHPNWECWGGSTGVKQTSQGFWGAPAVLVPAWYQKELYGWFIAASAAGLLARISASKPCPYLAWDSIMLQRRCLEKSLIWGLV